MNKTATTNANNARVYSSTVDVFLQFRIFSTTQYTRAYIRLCLCDHMGVLLKKIKNTTRQTIYFEAPPLQHIRFAWIFFFHAYCRFFFAAEIRFFFFFLKYRLVIRSKIVKHPTQLFVLYILWSIVKEETPFKEFPGNAGKPWRKTNLFTLENNTDGRTHCIELNSRRILRISTFHRSTRRNKNIYVINLP